jgi:hypothetical protein
MTSPLSLAAATSVSFTVSSGPAVGGGCGEPLGLFSTEQPVVKSSAAIIALRRHSAQDRLVQACMVAPILKWLDLTGSSDLPTGQAPTASLITT